MIPFGSDVIHRLRYSSYTGRVIHVHRALRRLDLGMSNWLHPLLLPLLFSALLLRGLDLITGFWAAMFGFWIDVLDLDARVTGIARGLDGVLSYTIPSIELAAEVPEPELALATTLVVGVAMTVSYLTLRRHLPWVYAIWALGFIQLSAVVMLSVFPALFPYDIRGHVASGMDMGLVLMGLVSWILAAAYYPLAFPLVSKLLGTLLILGYLVLFLPVQYLVHAWLLHHGSLLFMPILFIVFGFLLNIIAFIAIYGWAMSWRPREQ